MLIFLPSHHNLKLHEELEFPNPGGFHGVDTLLEAADVSGRGATPEGGPQAAHRTGAKAGVDQAVAPGGLNGGAIAVPILQQGE